ncbi:MAG TPA: hypothetical protein V6D05_00300 [Stenomitos sp.]
MKYASLSLALSVALVPMAASPSYAQIRRSVPTQAPAPAAAAHPGTELRIFIGPAFEGGHRRAFTTRTRTTGTAPTVAPTGATFTNASSSSTTIDQADFGDGLGVMYGVEGTWWGSDRLGLGASLFGAYLGAGTSTNLMPPASYPSFQTVGANTVSVTDVTNVNTGFGGTYTATVNAVPVGGGTADTTYGGWAGIPGAGTTFALRSGTQTGANPSIFSSTGGVAYSAGRTLWLNEIGLNGEYQVVDVPAGGVSFFGGFTMPMALMSQSFNAKTVGANGSGTVASETEKVDQGGGNTFTRVTEYELNETTKMDGSFNAIGPVIGLNAHYNLNPGTRLYTRLGYAPVLVGTANSSTVTSLNSRRSIIISDVQGTPTATVGTQRWETQVNTPAAPSVAPFSGSETIGSLGLGFGLGGYNLFAEGTARSYSLGAPLGAELIYGLKLGLNAGF